MEKAASGSSNMIDLTAEDLPDPPVALNTELRPLASTLAYNEATVEANKDSAARPGAHPSATNPGGKRVVIDLDTDKNSIDDEVDAGDDDNGDDDDEDIDDAGEDVRGNFGDQGGESEEAMVEIWDDESVISDIVHSMTSEEADQASRGARTPGERAGSEKISQRADLLKQLHRMGPHEFISEMLESDRYTPKGLCEALSGRIDLGIDSIPEDHDIYYRALGKIIKRELTKRAKLEHYNSMEDAVTLLKNSRNVLVLTGAGISTSLGIPDFRSKDGLYNMLRDSPLAEFVDDPQDVFSLELFLENPAIFFTVAKSILSPAQKFSPTHSFIRLLQDQGQLLTNYTQNIDNFEACAGIDPEKLVHCHGSFATATCIKCRTRVPGTAIEPEISAGTIPRCTSCLEMLRRQRESVGPTGMKRKRSWNAGGSAAGSKKKGRREEWEDSSEDDDMDDLSEDSAGVMKPDIVFFGEDLPQDFHQRLTTRDKDLVDLVIVIGTSLMVAPVADVPGFLPANVPQIFISREPCRHINFDIELLGDCDIVVAELCRRAGWDLKHHMIPANEEIDVRAENGLAWRHRFRRVEDLKRELAEAAEREKQEQASAAMEDSAPVPGAVKTEVKTQDPLGSEGDTLEETIYVNSAPKP